jgi:hypothetical protein
MLKRSLLNATKVSLVYLCFSATLTSCFPGRATCLLFGGKNCDGPPSPDGTPFNQVYFSPMRSAPGENKDSAQSPAVRGILGQIEAGPTIKLVGDEYQSDYVKTKPGVGIEFYAGSYWGGVAPNLFLHPAIGFKQARSIEEIRIGGDGGPDITRKTTSTFNFISLPLNAEYRFLNNQLGVFAGPEVDFLLGANMKTDGDREKITDQSKRLGLGVNGGLTYRPPARSKLHRISFQARASNRLTQLNTRGPSSVGTVPFRIKTVSFKVGYDLCNCN